MIRLCPDHQDPVVVHPVYDRLCRSERSGIWCVDTELGCELAAVGIEQTPLNAGGDEVGILPHDRKGRLLRRRGNRGLAMKACRVGVGDKDRAAVSFSIEDSEQYVA